MLSKTLLSKNVLSENLQRVSTFVSNTIISKLIDTAHKSNVSTKHSAMIIKGASKIVASGFNNNRSCMSGNPVCTQHAETAAILDLLSQNQARQSLKMFPNGKWFFLWDKTVTKPDKEVQIGCYPL